MTSPCLYPCTNKNELGYCLTTACINPAYQNITMFSWYIKNYTSPCENCMNNPKNGGTRICHCILGTPTIY